jgi:RHS repeat-associated protein
MNNAAGSNPTTLYYHTDALGSTRLVTKQTVGPVFSDNYQPYGQDNRVWGSETYKFTGKPYSNVTGLYYEYQRWYDPSNGRFISQDQLPGSQSSPQSFNRYSYALNQPTLLTDPSGLLSDDQAKAAEAVREYRSSLGDRVPLPQWMLDLLDGPAESAETVTAEVPDSLKIPTDEETSAGLGGASVSGPAVGSTSLDEFVQGVPKGELRPFTSTEDLTVRRAFGGDARINGEFYTTEDISSSSEAIQKLDLPQGPRGINTAQYMIEGNLPSGNDVLAGRTLAGYTQIQIENPLYRITITGIYVLSD